MGKSKKKLRDGSDKKMYFNWQYCAREFEINITWWQNPQKMVENNNQWTNYLGCTDENRVFSEEYAAGVPVCGELVPEHKVTFTEEILTKE
jgi:hypothetical protein